MDGHEGDISPRSTSRRIRAQHLVEIMGTAVDGPVGRPPPAEDAGTRALAMLTTTSAGTPETLQSPFTCSWGKRCPCWRGAPGCDHAATESHTGQWVHRGGRSAALPHRNPRRRRSPPTPAQASAKPSATPAPAAKPEATGHVTGYGPLPAPGSRPPRQPPRVAAKPEPAPTPAPEPTPEPRPADPRPQVAVLAFDCATTQAQWWGQYDRPG
jgi:hypothetical protein